MKFRFPSTGKAFLNAHYIFLNDYYPRPFLFPSSGKAFLNLGCVCAGIPQFRVSIPFKRDGVSELFLYSRRRRSDKKFLFPSNGTAFLNTPQGTSHKGFFI